MRRRVWLVIATVTVMTGIVLGLRDAPAPSVPAPGALPAAKHGAAMSMRPTLTRSGALVMLHIESPGLDVLYGSRVDVDVRTSRGWRNRWNLITDPTQPDPTAYVLRRNGPNQFWTLAGHSGAEDRRVRLPRLKPGAYRFRTGFSVLQPNDAREQFELAAPFIVA
jgi:hypothetical protein